MSNYIPPFIADAAYWSGMVGARSATTVVRLLVEHQVELNFIEETVLNKVVDLFDGMIERLEGDVFRYEQYLIDLRDGKPASSVGVQKERKNISIFNSWFDKNEEHLRAYEKAVQKVLPRYAFDFEMIRKLGRIQNFLEVEYTAGEVPVREIKLSMQGVAQKEDDEKIKAFATRLFEYNLFGANVTEIAGSFEYLADDIFKFNSEVLHRFYRSVNTITDMGLTRFSLKDPLSKKYMEAREKAFHTREVTINGKSHQLNVVLGKATVFGRAGYLTFSVEGMPRKVVRFGSYPFSAILDVDPKMCTRFREEELKEKKHILGQGLLKVYFPLIEPESIEDGAAIYPWLQICDFGHWKAPLNDSQIEMLKKLRSFLSGLHNSTERQTPVIDAYKYFGFAADGRCMQIAPFALEDYDRLKFESYMREISGERLTVFSYLKDSRDISNRHMYDRLVELFNGMKESGNTPEFKDGPQALHDEMNAILVRVKALTKKGYAKDRAVRALAHWGLHTQVISIQGWKRLPEDLERILLAGDVPPEDVELLPIFQAFKQQEAQLKAGDESSCVVM